MPLPSPANPLSPPRLVRFGTFEADFRSGELRRNGVKVKIQNLPFRALGLLLSRPRELVSREELRQALWPDGTYVDFDHGIVSALNRLRDALGDSAANPRFIETVGRHGYRWLAEAEVVDPPASAEPAPDTARPAGPQLVVPGSVLPLRRTSRRWYLLAAMAVAAIAAFGVWRMTRPQPAPAPVATTHAHHKPTPEAEDLYLKGRYYWNLRTPEGLNHAVDDFTQAIVRDPQYAEAYVGLADCYNLLREFAAMPAKDAYTRAEAAAQRAVELDDSLPDAHASLGFTKFYWSWDSASAEREFRRALEIDPNHVKAHHWYANMLHVQRRYDEALEQIELARKLAPDSKAILADKAEILLGRSLDESAITLLRQMETAEPGFVSPHRYLARIYLAQRDFRGFIAEQRQVAELTHDAAAGATADAAEKGFARGGENAALEAMLAVQKQLMAEGRATPYFLAQTNALMGRNADAIASLKQARDLHDEYYPYLADDPVLEGLHHDPRFLELVHSLFPGVKF